MNERTTRCVRERERMTEKEDILVAPSGRRARFRFPPDLDAGTLREGERKTQLSNRRKDQANEPRGYRQGGGCGASVWLAPLHHADVRGSTEIKNGAPVFHPGWPGLSCNQSERRSRGEPTTRPRWLSATPVSPSLSLPLRPATTGLAGANPRRGLLTGRPDDEGMMWPSSSSPASMSPIAVGSPQLLVPICPQQPYHGICYMPSNINKTGSAFSLSCLTAC